MGVTGLWSVVAPTARPTKLETLNRKRLAVDASIWIYQFLKAVRDKEGNALRNSHVVGFFRRICKLLYFGILPVFVFDGGAPSLKRETIQKRRRRREGRREDATRTAGKLLAVQVARAAENEDKRRREAHHVQEEEIHEGDELVYVDEIGMNKQERQHERASRFKKKDQYHLPNLDVSLEAMGAPNDPRIMSQAELEEYARQFHSGEDINLYDFSKIDFESPFFLSLPAGDRYNILNAARLRSRLRMGYSKEQLDDMFPDRMAFSRFQIERVKERNELTQRLMHLNGMNEDWNSGGRIAGEKGKEYILVKNDGVEGGWALGVVSNKQGTKREDAIDVDEDGESANDGEQDDVEDDFEDVAIEGLNRLPKRLLKRKNVENFDATEEIARKRKAIYAERRRVVERAVNSPVAMQPEQSLFVAQDGDQEEEEEDELFEDVLLKEPDEDEDLQTAIAMSLEPQNEPDSDDESDLAAALAQTRKPRTEELSQKFDGPLSFEYDRATALARRTEESSHKFDGPLPFESLNLGQSLLGKKKADKMEQDLSGGFDRDLGTDSKKKKSQPLPAWFNASAGEAFQPQSEESDSDDHITYGREDVDRREFLRRHTTEVIDLEAEEAEDAKDGFYYNGKMEGEDDVGVEDEALNEDDEEKEREVREAREREARYELAREIAAENEDKREGAMEKESSEQNEEEESLERNADEEDVEWSESDREDEDDFEDVAIPLLQPDVDPPGESADAVEDVAIPILQPDAHPPLAELIDTEDEFEDVTIPVPQTDVIEEVDDTTAAADEPQTTEDYDGYLSDSEEELMRQLTLEAEGHAEFASSLNQMKTPAQAARDYENELKQLRNQQKKDRRDADEVTQTMIQECQALLRLFGLPYITAPMEAEAQCAELVHLGLVDGIVTDDSDIFLFGGTRIYKNMFNAAKFVECYVAQDLEKEYDLDRKKLIRFAHLLGSDYTEGIPGIGPVTALEIISDFSDLEAFRDWCSRVQLARPQDLEHQLTTPFRRKFKKSVQKRLFLPPVFPDQRVDYAYLNPEVDSNPEDFQWGVPDLDKLRGYLMATIGWSQDRTDEILVPVIRDMNKREQEGTQANITRFFTGGAGAGAVTTEGTAPRNRTGKESGRMKNAYARLRGEAKKRRLQDEEAAE